MFDVMDFFSNAGIEYVLTVPDSWGSRLITILRQSGVCHVLQCATEMEALTIAAGLNVSGVISVILIENSGIRSVADALSRFELSHKLHNIFLLSDRGGFGESNWWGAKHRSVTDNIIKELGIDSIEVFSPAEFNAALIMAVKTFRNEQVSVAVRLQRRFWEGLDNYDN